jgi:hypothetical protein
VTVVPADRFEHDDDESTKLTGNVSTVAPPFAAIALVTPTRSATTMIAAVVSRFTVDLLANPEMADPCELQAGELVGAAGQAVAVRLAVAGPIPVGRRAGTRVC